MLLFSLTARWRWLSPTLLPALLPTLPHSLIFTTRCAGTVASTTPSPVDHATAQSDFNCCRRWLIVATDLAVAVIVTACCAVANTTAIAVAAS